MRLPTFYKVDIISSGSSPKRYTFVNVIGIKHNRVYIELLQRDKRACTEEYITICNDQFDRYTVEKQEDYIDG